MRNLRLRDDNRDDRPRTELAERAESMIAVRRPVLSIAGRHGNHRVEKAIERVDGLRESADVRFGKITLKGRGLDALQGQRGKELPMSAQWIAIGGEHCPLVVRDRAGKGGNRHWRRRAR